MSFKHISPWDIFHKLFLILIQIRYKIRLTVFQLLAIRSQNNSTSNTPFYQYARKKGIRIKFEMQTLVQEIDCLSYATTKPTNSNSTTYDPKYINFNEVLVCRNIFGHCALHRRPILWKLQTAVHTCNISL